MSILHPDSKDKVDKSMPWKVCLKIWCKYIGSSKILTETLTAWIKRNRDGSKWKKDLCVIKIL